MATTLLTTGVSNAIAQTTSYALPANTVFIMSSVAVELSVDNTNWVPVAATTTGVATAARFVRCTTAAAVVSLTRY